MSLKPKVEEEQKQKNSNTPENSDELKKFEVDGIVPVMQNGDVVPHFGNKSRGKYIKHKELSKEQVLELRREQNREAARRMRRKKSQQRAFLEQEIAKLNEDINTETKENKITELNNKLKALHKSREEVIAVQNRSSKNKNSKRKRSNTDRKNRDNNNEPLQKKQKRSNSSQISASESTEESSENDHNNDNQERTQQHVQLVLPQFQVLQPVRNVLPTGFRRSNFRPPPTLIIKQKVSPPNANGNQSANINGQRILHPMITPINMTTSPFLIHTPFNSPQMFSYHSPQSLGSGRWLISPFKQRINTAHTTQISPNMNFVCTPLNTQFQQPNLNINVNVADENTDINEQENDVKIESNVNIEYKAEEANVSKRKSVKILEDKKVGTDDIVYNNIGINTDRIDAN
eukprot:515907_1